MVCSPRILMSPRSLLDVHPDPLPLRGVGYGRTNMKALRQLFPEHWLVADAKALVAIYRVVRVPRQGFGVEPYVFDIGTVRAALFWGSLQIPKPECEPQFTEAGEIHLAVSLKNDASPLEGRYCLLATRMSEDVPEPDARSLIEAGRGLLCAYHGRNVAYDRVSEFMFDLSNPAATTFVTPSFENPLALPVPRLRRAERIRFETLLKNLNQRDRHRSLEDRLHLSCRWFGSAIEHSGPDAFLRYWIALEALAMPDSTNIVAVNEHLARSYGLSFDQAAQRFLVGRLFGFRGQIVHRGSQRPVPGTVLSYIAAVYIDVLLQVFGLPPEGRAESELQASGATLEHFFGIGSNGGSGADPFPEG